MAKTIYHFIEQGRQTEACQLIPQLLTTHINILICGESLLSFAIRKKQKACFDALLALPGVNVNQWDHYNFSPLFWACHVSDNDVIECLLAHPDIQPGQCGRGKSALNYALQYACSEAVVARLIAWPGMNLHDVDDYLHDTLLHDAIARGQPRMLVLLLAASDQCLNQANDSGETPLHYTVWYGQMECLQLLLAHPNIDVHAMDNKGQTALHIVVTSQPAWYVKQRLGRFDRQACRVLLTPSLFWCAQGRVNMLMPVWLQCQVGMAWQLTWANNVLWQALPLELKLVVLTYLTH